MEPSIRTSILHQSNHKLAEMSTDQSFIPSEWPQIIKTAHDKSQPRLK